MVFPRRQNFVATHFRPQQWRSPPRRIYLPPRTQLAAAAAAEALIPVAIDAPPIPVPAPTVPWIDLPKSKGDWTFVVALGDFFYLMIDHEVPVPVAVIIVLALWRKYTEASNRA